MRDVVSAVLHPAHLAMPELYSIAASPDQVGVLFITVAESPLGS